MAIKLKLNIHDKNISYKKDLCDTYKGSIYWHNISQILTQLLAQYWPNIANIDSIYSQYLINVLPLN